MADLVGRSLGRYHILEQLGEGGMAVVYKAYDTRLERDVAVKVIRTENLPQSGVEKALKRFEREAKALAKLTHPNIVPITDFGEHDGKPYLVMPYLPSGTLKQRLGKPIPAEEAVRVLIPIARALQYAHQQGIIHRDVKPSNILITQSGEPMLTDFGIAKILLDTEATADLTGTGMGVGTPEYMSPEQFQGRGVDARTDVYSLGVVLYEMITGRKPYQADTPAAILIKQATDPLPRPRSFVPDMPQAVENVLLKALAKKTEDRYQSISELIFAMEGLLDAHLSGGRQKTGTELSQQTQTFRPKTSPLARYWKIWVPGLVIIVLAGSLLAVVNATRAPAPQVHDAPTLPTSISQAVQVPTATAELTLNIDTSTPSITNVAVTATQGMMDTLKYGSLLYQDNFDIDTGGWALHQGSVITNGELILPPGSSATIPNWDGRYSNFIFEAKFRFINPEQVHYTAVYLRIADPPCPAGNCSTQVFVSSGRNIAAWHLGSQIKQLMNYTDAPQLDPNTYNALAVVANGDNFSVFINSVFVRSFSDNAYTSGIVAVDADGASTAYDYIRIYSLP